MHSRFTTRMILSRDPEQPGPKYFLVPRMCGIFGMGCESIPQQVNYLTDEGMSCGKGSNPVVSYLHHFFSNFGLGETSVDLHCDNCSGQNKNRYMLWYLALRTIHRLHSEVTWNFIIAARTKFGPDWCFGLFKQRYRRCHISDLNDIAEAVSTSTLSGVSIPQLVGREKRENDEVEVNTFDWQTFLAPHFKPLPAIKDFHHMRFDADHPGVVYYKEYDDSPERSFQLLKKTTVLPPLSLPEQLTPPGLSDDRRWYLCHNIRQYCAQDERADRSCPIVPRPTR